MRHIIRPYRWAEQVVLLLPDLTGRDGLVLPSPIEQFVATALFQQWKMNPKIKLEHLSQDKNCLRCGDQACGDFCYSCKHGQLHANTCPKFWVGIDFSVLEAIGRKVTVNVNAKCNCGGDELVARLADFSDKL